MNRDYSLPAWFIRFLTGIIILGLFVIALVLVTGSYQ